MIHRRATTPLTRSVPAAAARPGPRNGLAAVPVEAVWEQLWSVLEEGGVLKKKKAK